ncbi:MAG: hypothetical protein ABL921_00985 [Pirellula sp.]
MQTVRLNHVGRRTWMIASIAAATSFALPRGEVLGQPTMGPSRAESKGLCRVRAELEVNGEIRLKSQLAESTARDPKSKADRTAPIKAKSTIDYDEHYETASNMRACRSYQHFHEANSEIQIDRNVTKTTLREQCRDILRMGTDTGVVTICPDNPLFSAECDLVECPVNSMFLEQLLTDAEVNIADKWALPSETTCRLLNLDAVQEGKLVVCLIDADSKMAQLEITGSVTASVRQVPTSVTVDGKAQLDRKTGTITWLAVNLEETREISEAEPGFRVMAQLRMRRAVIENMTSGLSLDGVAARVGNVDAASMLQFQSDLGYYRFLASRKWSTYRDNGEEATLRFIVNNRVVAQCNVTNMIDFEPGRQLSMDGFVADVKKALGNNAVEIAESTEKLSNNKLRILRVVSQGSVQGVDIRWIHYHISNDNGRRVVLAFTLNDANTEVFSMEDEQLVSSFELIDWPTKLDAKAIESAAKTGTDQGTNPSAVNQPKKSEPKTSEQLRNKLSR